MLCSLSAMADYGNTRQITPPDSDRFPALAALPIRAAFSNCSMVITGMHDKMYYIVSYRTSYIVSYILSVVPYDAPHDRR